MKVIEKIKKFLKIFGPGWITGASDDDPSGIGTYSYSGSRFGLGQIWTSLFTFPLMTAVQELCARIGQVTGKGLASTIKRHCSKKVLYFSVILLIFANIFNIGADIGIMAASMKLVIDWPFYFWAIFFTFVTLFLEVFISYKTYVKYLKWLSLSLFAYIITAFVANPNWFEVLKKLVIPNVSLEKEFIFTLVAILGTTISPYLFFWQTSEEVEEEIADGKTTVAKRRGSNKKEIRGMRLDVIVGMFFSNLMQFFIVLTSATALYVNSITVTSAENAAAALAPISGSFSSLLFAIGIIGTGLMAIPVLAGSASYAISEVFGLKEGLSKKLSQAKGFYAIIVVATMVGLFINFIGIEPVKALVWAAVINGVVAPVLLIIIVKIGNNKGIMGKWKNGLLSNILVWVTIVLMSLAALVLLIQSFI